MKIQSMARRCYEAAQTLMAVDEGGRKNCLTLLANNLLKYKEDILRENHKDVVNAKQNHLKSSLIDRLILTEKSIHQLSKSCLEIASFPQVVGNIISETMRPDGLLIKKQRVPIGVIALIFESRPNVVIDAAALAIKSGNALIFKGGSDAQHSNFYLWKVLQESIQPYFSLDSIQIVSAKSDVEELITLDQYINLVIPRGGQALVKMVKAKSSIPVISHDRGLCHLYIHHDAPKELAINIVINAKTSRPGVCNALESLLIHKNFPYKQELLESLHAHHVKLKVDSQLLAFCSFQGAEQSMPSDYDQEWLDYILSVKEVEDESVAVAHIQKHGTKHTEGIISHDVKVIEYFLNHVDASCITVNASTRFNDGGELGLGAEMGISTSKLHAYGPMGANELTTTRYLVEGKGHIRV